MNAPKDHHQELERMLTVFVLAALVLFVAYLALAVVGQPVLKLVSAVLAILISIFSLWVLVNTKELLKQRSLWLSCSFASITLCIIVSLLCQFP